MLFPKAIIQSEFEANAPLRAALRNEGYSASGIYLTPGLVITAAHLTVGWPGMPKSTLLALASPRPM
jgi:hypothetical protein